MLVNTLLEPYITPLLHRVYRNVLDEMQRAYDTWTKAGAIDADHPDIHAAEFLAFFVRREIETIVRLRFDFDTFNANYSRTITKDERRQHILNYARTLGASKKEFKEDKKALDRWLGHDAMQERCLVRVGRCEQRIVFCLDRMYDCITIPRQDHLPMEEPLVMWQKVQPETLLTALIGQSGNRYVVEAALKFLARLMVLMPGLDDDHAAVPGISEELIHKLYRFALEDKQPAGIKAGSLRVLQMVDPDGFRKILKEKLDFRLGPDAIFIRKECVKILGDSFSQYPDLIPLVGDLMSDPSPFVRQELVRVIGKVSPEYFRKYSRYLAQRDKSPQVRAVMVLEIGCLARKGFEMEHCRHLLSRVLLHEKDELVLRTAVKVTRECGQYLVNGSPASGSAGAGHRWIDMLSPVLAAVHRQSENLVIRRQAARALEYFRLMVNPRAMLLYSFLEETAGKIKPGGSKRLPPWHFNEYDDETLGRVMAMVAGDDYGLSLHKGKFRWELFRGPEFRFRWWRFLHELRRSSPDKRQGYSHTRGRHFHGQIHAPSSLLAELTETKVPGEPLVIRAEQGWRPYLPLPDHIVSTLKLIGPAPPHRLYTSEGVTTITPPGNWLARFGARMKLTSRFNRYAGMRNWTDDQPGEPASYIKALGKLGFKITFRHHTEPEEEFAEHEDPSVTRFFTGMGFAFPSFGEIWERIQDYFISLYENSFLELIIFTAAALLIFFGRHLYLNAKHKKTRDKIPLVIGGWGTRGKSGTERLKAALINSRGLDVVSKTTGSEATFLHAWPYGDLYEIPLFRPYDKATIWEQQDITRIAGGLEAEVLLWECMALQPAYVDVLQQDWMRDNLATITNTYPDHEDVMGPAGIDIPEVMTRFIPKNATLFTSEEQMLPVLREGAKRAGSIIKNVGWFEAGLLTEDVLARFPYNEHPYNIALVLALAEELGICRDVALKEMADRVVAEIGMLKTFPRARVDTVTLEFTNGMAANERVGLLSNWQRMGFDTQDYEAEPGVFISTVVNNRADRIPRSQVFARIIARDIGADRHILIGSNLTGLKGYIRGAWDEYSQEITLFTTQQDIDPIQRALDVMESMIKHFRLPFNRSIVKHRLEIMLNAIYGETGENPPPDLITLYDNPSQLDQELKKEQEQSLLTGEHHGALIAHLESDLTAAQEVTQWQERIKTAEPGQHETLNNEFRQFLGKWFEKKIIVIWDFHAPGDAVIQQIARQTPPGFLNRVMGVQNIKGTGFDFVGKWQAWEQCHKALQLLESEDETEYAKGLSQLAATTNFGLLSKKTVPEKVETFKHTPPAQNERVQAQLMIIENQLEKAMERVNELITKETAKKGFFTRVLDWIEGFLDAGDAVKRKKQVLKIYKDLTNQRISHPRAIEEIQKLNKRQKGGWLIRGFTQIFK